jgi:hypothetical protein
MSIGLTDNSRGIDPITAAALRRGFFETFPGRLSEQQLEITFMKTKEI